jgi:hypothetical protein
MQPNDVHHITPQLQQMYETVRAAMPKWQRYIIGIDGREGK